jgi:beta-glucosidase
MKRSSVPSICSPVCCWFLNICAALAAGGSVPAAESLAFRDPEQPLDARVQDLVSRLTLEEKAILLNHRGPTIERFQIRGDQWNQCLNGVKWDRPTTLFPSCIAMAATWNQDLVHEIATVLSDEARAIYNRWHLDPKAPGEHKGLIYRAPVINIGRNPYWGRNHEAWGEDPFLTGRMAVAYVRGLQGTDPRFLKIAATLKHFAVNNVETDRKKLNAVVPQRMLREYWLPHFRDAVIEGRAQSLMASYNAINGTPNNINHWLLTEVLKEEWHHEGFVVSDLGGVRTMVAGHAAGRMSYVDAVAQSLMAGCDFSDKEYMDNIPAAVRAGKLTEARLNDALSRVLRVRFRLGEFDPFELVPYSRISPEVIDCAAHRAVALQAAQQSLVLLQNRDHLLPLDRDNLRQIAVLGPLADEVITNNYNGRTGATVSPLQGLRNRKAQETHISYARGCDVVGAQDETETTAAAAAIAQQADVALLFVGTTAAVEHEGRDRTALGLPGHQEDLVRAVLAANPRTVVVQLSAGPLTVPWLQQNIPALLQAWWPGEEGGHAIADVLFGNVNPAGRLPHTVYAREDQVPPLDEYDVSRGFTYLYLRGEPLFAFGHGLSYTAFAYDNLRISAGQLPADGEVTVQADITNTGPRAGDEVVQLYVRDAAPRVTRPLKELRGFARVSLQPQEKRTVTFTLPAARLAFFDEQQAKFTVPEGRFDLLVGSSSADIRLTGSVEVVSGKAGPREARAEEEALAGAVIVVDPGHGGQAYSRSYTGGTRGVTSGLLESELNLRVALVLAQLLREAGAEVHLTREADHRLSREGSSSREELHARIDFLQRHQPHFFVSIHHNAARPHITGHTALYKHNADDDTIYEALARTMNQTLVGAVPGPALHLIKGNYHILRETRIPGTIVEAGFLTNAQFDELANRPEFPQTEATAIRRGAIQFWTEHRTSLTALRTELARQQAEQQPDPQQVTAVALMPDHQTKMAQLLTQVAPTASYDPSEVSEYVQRFLATVVTDPGATVTIAATYADEKIHLSGATSDRSYHDQLIDMLVAMRFYNVVNEIKLPAPDR